MAFKISTGTGDVSYDAWSQPGVHDGGPGCSPRPGIPCSSIYKDVVVDKWSSVEQVRNTTKYLEIYVCFIRVSVRRWWRGCEFSAQIGGTANLKDFLPLPMEKVSSSSSNFIDTGGQNWPMSHTKQHKIPQDKIEWLKQDKNVSLQTVPV